jgi:hypothetical protein
MKHAHRIALSISAASLLATAAASAAPCDHGHDDERDVCRPRDIFLMPGAQAVVYRPAAKDAGTFVGAGVHWAPYQWSRNTDRFGPSQGSVYLQATLMRSPAYDSTLALVEGGTTLSFERNSSRGFLIPYFGSSVGYLSHGTLPSGGFAFPNVGIHALYHPHLMLDLEGGYMLPFRDLDVLRGARGDAVMRVSLW